MPLLITRVYILYSYFTDYFGEGCAISCYKSYSLGMIVFVLLFDIFQIKQSAVSCKNFLSFASNCLSATRKNTGLPKGAKTAQFVLGLK